MLLTQSQSCEVLISGSSLLYTALLKKKKAKHTAARAEAERSYAIKGDDAMGWIQSG